MTATTLNAMGLFLITVGGIGAAVCTPTPLYHPDGSVSLAGEPDKRKRIWIYRKQLAMKPLLCCVGIGAAFQFAALYVG